MVQWLRLPSDRAVQPCMCLCTATALKPQANTALSKHSQRTLLFCRWIGMPCGGCVCMRGHARAAAPDSAAAETASASAPEVNLSEQVAKFVLEATPGVGVTTMASSSKSVLGSSAHNHRQ